MLLRGIPLMTRRTIGVKAGGTDEAAAGPAGVVCAGWNALGAPPTGSSAAAAGRFMPAMAMATCEAG